MVSKWPYECVVSFQKLKILLITSPIEKLLVEEEEFIVYCGVLQIGLGYVLMQKGEIIAYTSRQLKVHPNHDLGFAMVVSALII